MQTVRYLAMFIFGAASVIAFFAWIYMRSMTEQVVTNVYRASDFVAEVTAWLRNET